jgi:hypothetical protein
VDPFTLLALASSAVSAVKKGCQLYKDVKSAAGDVRAVLADLESQFKSKHKDKPPSKAEVQQFNEEKRRVQDVGKADPNDVYAKVSDQLGDFFDAVDKIEELLWSEERAAKRVYSGDVSLKRRALQRVMIRTRLEAMHTEMREIMVYQSPPEMGDLWTRFEAMREQINQEQEQARAEQARKDAHEAWQREQRRIVWQDRSIYLVAMLVVLLEMWALWWSISLQRRGQWSLW